MQPLDRCSLHKQRRGLAVVTRGLFRFLLNRLLQCVCVCVWTGELLKGRRRQRLTAFLEMPFHWSKHHSNIVPPMTRQQPVVLKEWCEAEGYTVWGEQVGGIEFGGCLGKEGGLGSVLAWGSKLKLRFHHMTNLLSSTAANVFLFCLTGVFGSFHPVLILLFQKNK